MGQLTAQSAFFIFPVFFHLHDLFHSSSFMQVLMIILQRSVHVFDNHFKVSLASSNRFSILSLILYLHCMCSFNNSSNQAMAKKLLTEVRAVFSEEKWMKSTVEGK